MKNIFMFIGLLLVIFIFSIFFYENGPRYRIENKIPGLSSASTYQKIVLLRNHVYVNYPDFCNRMATRYVNLLKIYKIKARRVVLQDEEGFKTGDIRNSHTSVEVFYNGHWEIQDPTFNVHFELNGKNLNFLELSQSMILIPATDGFPLIKGRSVQEYYISYSDMLAHIFIKEKKKIHDITKNDYE